MIAITATVGVVFLCPLCTRQAEVSERDGDYSLMSDGELRFYYIPPAAINI